MKNSELRLRKLVMFYDVLLLRHQHLRMSLRHTFCDLVTLRKRHRLVAKEDHSFENGYDKSTLSYEELPNKRVVAKVT